MFDPVSLGIGLLGAGAKFAQGQAAAGAANANARRQYAQQLKIREQNWRNSLAQYGNKLAVYDQEMTAADRAASRAYGAEQLRQSQAIDKAVFANRRLDLALAKSGGRASASGASGLSAQRRDASTESAYVRNQQMITQNLLAGSIAGDYRNMAIRDQYQSARNRAFSQVAVAPIQPLAPMAPMMQSGPSPLGLALDIGSSFLNSYENPAPDPEG